jgi:hypothetical protein
LTLNFSNSTKKCTRSLAAGVLSLALLAPFLGGLLLFAQNDQCARKMTCCARAKISDCRHAGAGWAAKPVCPSGSDQKNGPPSPLLATSAARYCDGGPVLAVRLARGPANRANVRGSGEFGLFGRPPPSLVSFLAAAAR